MRCHKRILWNPWKKKKRISWWMIDSVATVLVSEKRLRSDAPVVTVLSSHRSRLGVCQCDVLRRRKHSKQCNNSFPKSGAELPRRDIWCHFGNSFHVIGWSCLSKQYTQEMWNIFAEKTIAVGKLLSVFIWTQGQNQILILCFFCSIFFSYIEG